MTPVRFLSLPHQHQVFLFPSLSAVLNCTTNVAVATGRSASVQPSPRGGDGFSTPLIGSLHRRPPANNSLLEEARAKALAAHSADSKSDSIPGANLTDDLLNL